MFDCLRESDRKRSRRAVVTKPTLFVFKSRRIGEGDAESVSVLRCNTFLITIFLLYPSHFSCTTS